MTKQCWFLTFWHFFSCYFPAMNAWCGESRHLKTITIISPVSLTIAFPTLWHFSTCLYLLEKAVVFVFVLYWYLYLHLCLYFSHLGMKWRERAPIIPIDVRHKLQKRFTVSFPLAFSISPNTTASQPRGKKDFWKSDFKFVIKSNYKNGINKYKQGSTIAFPRM